MTTLKSADTSCISHRISLDPMDDLHIYISQSTQVCCCPFTEYKIFARKASICNNVYPLSLLYIFLFSLQQHCVTGHLYLGFSDLSSDHFFYGTLSPVSLQKLLEVYNIQHKLPGAIATIGFPEGLQVQSKL